MGMPPALRCDPARLHCLLDDDDPPRHSGESYSQQGILYPDRKNRPGGWPMRPPNPLVCDDALAERLDRVSRKLVGLEERPVSA